VECLYTQTIACHHSAVIIGDLPFPGVIPSSANMGIGPEKEIQGEVGTRRAMALTNEQSLREAIALEEALLAELSHQHNDSQK
jgi:hypothetical protein